MKFRTLVVVTLSAGLASPVVFTALGATPAPAKPAAARKTPFKTPPNPKAPQKLIEQLEGLRVRVIDIERGLIASLKTQKQTQNNIQKIRILMDLRRQEREIGRKRMSELESTIKELESRRSELGTKVRQHQKSVTKFLTAIESAEQESPARKALPIPLQEREKLEAPRRKVLANLVSRGLREIEILKVDLADADKLEARIGEEKQQLTNLLQDLDEKEQVLELNRQLQADILRQKHEERVAQLENYRRLKSAEEQVENLIQEFNARRELERNTETERAAAKAMSQGVFASLKGRLPLPLASGKIVASFGRAYDPKSQLYIFRKGIDLAGTSAGPEAVRAVSAGKVAYSGELPGYGQVVIVDHGEHFYSLCAHLGELGKKAGEPVAAGDVIGKTDDSGTPVYFEIRARNVAVNPLQWISN